jgi:hypothetical protein
MATPTHKGNVSPSRSKSNLKNPLQALSISSQSNINNDKSKGNAPSVSPNRQPRRTRAERLKQKQESPPKGSLMVGKNSIFHQYRNCKEILAIEVELEYIKIRYLAE